jgi:2,3-bisphosphoglycerate-independent phosphoglycerate mutase
MKLIYVILDGIGDRPIKALGKRTPLEAAKKNHFDELAAKSKLGLIWTVGREIAPESDAATIALFGYNPFECYKGRGPLEALGAGIKLRKNDVAIRCNFALDKNNLIENVEADITNEEGKELGKIISKNIRSIDGVRIIFRHTVGYRAVLILRGKNLSPRISNTHPSYKIYKYFVSEALPTRKNIAITKCKPLDNSKESAFTAEIVNKFLEKARTLLNKSAFKHRANIILTRGAGSELPKLEKLESKWTALADMPAEKALAKLMGMKIEKKAKGFGNLAKQALKLLKKSEAIYIHIKDTDILSHKGDYEGKKAVIEKFDREFLANLIHSPAFKDIALCITGDHSTPCELRAHSSDLVPVLLYVPGELGDCMRFGETFAAKGSLGKFSSNRLFNVLQKLLLFD